MEGFVNLRCPNCGGEIKVQHKEINDMFIHSGKRYFYIGDKDNVVNFKCIHCQTEFLRKQEFESVVKDSVIVTGNNNVVAGKGSIIVGNITSLGSRINISLRNIDESDL